MSRPLRIEYEGAVYHVTARGNAGQDIYRKDPDRQKFLSLLAREIEQQRWLCHAYCLMGNHYHLLLETPEANLSRGMGRLNGSYTQWFNRRHGLHGHLMQGRYRAILVEKENYLLELCRYIVLNPVRAKIVERVERWRWSSYRATVGSSPPPHSLRTEWILSQFDGDRRKARAGYRRFVKEGLQAPSPWGKLRGQIYLGSEGFLRSMKARIESRGGGMEQVCRAMQVPDRPDVKEIIERVAQSLGVSPEEALDRRKQKEAFWLVVYLLRRVGNLPLKQVAALAGVSPSRVCQIQKSFEESRTSLLLNPEITAFIETYQIRC